MLEGIGSLVDTSLLHPMMPPNDAPSHADGVPAAPGAPRFAMLETIREFGLERLAAGKDADATRRRHAGWCLDLAERARAALLGWAGQGPWLDLLEAEVDNLRAALVWLEETGATEDGLRLAGAMWPFWFLRGRWREGRGWLERVLARSEAAPAALRVRAQFAAGHLAHFQGDDARAEALIEESRARWREMGDTAGAAMALHTLALVAEDRGDYERAAPRFEEALALLEQVGDAGLAAVARYHLGEIAYGRGDIPRAMTLLTEALARSRAGGNTWGAACALGCLGLVAGEQGDLVRAAGWHTESLAWFRQAGYREAIPSYLAGVAVLAAMGNHPAAATRLFGAAEVLSDAFGAVFALPERATYERATDGLRARLGEPAFVAEWAAGRLMTLEEAVAEASAVAGALRNPPAVADPRDPATRAGLTPREVDVLRLLVGGRSNAEIAAALFVSHATARTHVGNVLAKLGVHSRTEAVDVAHRRGLLARPDPPAT